MTITFTITAFRFADIYGKLEDSIEEHGYKFEDVLAVNVIRISESDEYLVSMIIRR